MGDRQTCPCHHRREGRSEQGTADISALHSDFASRAISYEPRPGWARGRGRKNNSVQRGAQRYPGEFHATLFHTSGKASVNGSWKPTKVAAVRESWDLYRQRSDRQQVLEAIERDQAVRNARVHFKKKDGTPMVAVLNISLIPVDDGEPQLLGTLVEDKTDNQ